MSDPKKIKSALHVLNQAAKDEGLDMDALEHACSVWRAVAEAEKFEAEVDNVRRPARSEAMRFWFSTLAPVATVVVLGATLTFQVFQFNRTSQESRAADEERQWRDTLKTLSDPRTLTGIGGFVQLKSFFTSRRYVGPTREYAIHLLGARGAVMMLDVFEMLFPSVIETTTWENHGDIVRMLGRMRESHTLLVSKLDAFKERDEAKNSKSTFGNEAMAQPRPPPMPPPPPNMSGPMDEEAEQFQRQQNPEQIQRDLDTLDNEIRSVGKAFAKFLRDQRPPKTNLDLSEAIIWEADFSEMDLGVTVCSNTSFWSCDLKNADLEGIINFSDSTWWNTAWWRAKRINRPLLNYLKSGEYAFKKGDYYPGDKPATEEEYNTELSRLEKQTR